MDYAQLEAFVTNKLIAGKPLISKEDIRMFSFSDEVHIGVIPRLIREKVDPQIELGEEEKTRIWNELGNDQVRQQCLRTLDICMNFLKTAGGDPKQELAEYAKSVLALTADDLRQCGFSLPALDAVQLQHVLSLWSLLFSKLNPNPLDTVQSCYKVKMNKQQKDAMTAFVKPLSSKALELLRETLHEFCTTYLTEDTYQANQALADFVGQLLKDAEFANAPLPNSLTLAHSVDVHDWITKKIADMQPRNAKK